ncbi:GNAT family N-acetyltransferase [Paenibacillus albidus]|nr:GNAT family N-acetyltransferase [Paenibacillus albidus]
MFVCGGSVPTLNGRSLDLRAMTADDAEALYRIWGHPQVAPWLGMPPLSSVEETRLLIDQLLDMSLEEENLRWSILGPEGEVIGSCGYNNWQLEGAYRGEIGCELAPECWGQGMMTEALGLVLDYGFDKMGLNRIEALCHPDNGRAAGLVQSLGFRQEGILRDYRHLPSGFQDVLLYSLLSREWR